MNPDQQQGSKPRDYHWKPGENPFFTQPTPDNPSQAQNLPVQQPEVYNSPSLADIPYGAQPSPQPQVAPVSTKNGGGPNKLVIVVIAGIALVFILGIIALVMSSNGNKGGADKTLEAPANTQSQSLQPAESIDLEQTNNAISQDMSSLDDENDFPANSLDDKTLNL